MITFLIIMASLFGYGSMGLIVTRMAYIREYKRYLSWKNEGGNYHKQYPSAYTRPPRLEARKGATYGDYRRSVSTTAPPGLLGATWIVSLPAIGASKFVHPEVKAPDYHKISELENL